MKLLYFSARNFYKSNNTLISNGSFKYLAKNEINVNLMEPDVVNIAVVVSLLKYNIFSINKIWTFPFDNIIKFIQLITIHI